MKKIFYTGFMITTLILFFASCKKDEVKAVLHPGEANTLTASSETLVLDSANAENTQAADFNWEAVKYGVDVAATYTLQIDTLNDKHFENAMNVPMANKLSKSYTVAELNQLALLFGLEPDSVGKLQVRVATDVKGLNSAPQQVATVYSNTIILKITPYSTKPKPKYPVPENLYIVGSATAGGWTNPVSVPSQQFTQIDDHTFGIIIPLTGGGEYLLLPENGQWAKYSVPDNTDPALKTGGAFEPEAKYNIPGPETNGLYKIIVDFVKGTYTVTPVDPSTLPTNLYIVGSATAGGWDNPVPLPAQQFTQTSIYTFTITINLTGGMEYLLLPVNGSWDHKFSVADNTIESLRMGGTFKADAPDNFPGPKESGTYRIDVNFLTWEYTVTKL